MGIRDVGRGMRITERVLHPPVANKQIHLCSPEARERISSTCLPLLHRKTYPPPSEKSGCRDIVNSGKGWDKERKGLRRCVHMSSIRIPRTQALIWDFLTQVFLQMLKREEQILPKVTQRVNDRVRTVSELSGKVTTFTAKRAI